MAVVRILYVFYRAHRTYFFRLAERMKVRQWYVDSAVLNAVEACWKATSSAISAIRLEQDQKEREIKPGFVLPPPTRTDHSTKHD